MLAIMGGNVALQPRRMLGNAGCSGQQAPQGCPQCWLLHRQQPTSRPGWRRSTMQPQLLATARQVSVAATESSSQITAAAEDKWIARTLTSFSAAPDAVSAEHRQLRDESLNALQTLRMPTNRNEEYRFTDISALLQSNLQAPRGSEEGRRAEADLLPLDQSKGSRLVLVDGVLAPQLSDLSSLPEGVYVGSIASAPESSKPQLALLGSLSRERGGPFACLNGALAADVAVFLVPAGVQVAQPLHILYLSSGGDSEGSRPASAPRLLVSLEAGASAEVVEEFPPAAAAASRSLSFTAAVAEFELGEGASLRHGYVQLEAPGAVHVKASLVRQAKNSSYIMTEASLGGALSRHDVGIMQAGPETVTEMRTFMLSGDKQLHDLHSKLVLQHPEGKAVQLHKCIVASATGRGVFDGSVKVEKLAQRTDAGQLSRTLLLVPRATVNVKPNLQIVADDVKCTHGCAVSDLEEEQLFYFMARGIDSASARRLLVNSFGSEVTRELQYPQLLARVEAAVKTTLATAGFSAEAPALTS